MTRARDLMPQRSGRSDSVFVLVIKHPGSTLNERKQTNRLETKGNIMQNYRVWVLIVLLASVLAPAQAADHEVLQPWPYGSYDKNIEIKRSVPSSSTKPLVVSEAPSADEVLAQAKAKASAEDKAIFLHFGASWCGWCRKLDAFLERPDTKPVFEKYFVSVKLVVQENEKNKALENPGADALLKKFGGPAGLPYCAFLDAQGALIINSRRPSAVQEDGENICYPGGSSEIDWFMQMIRKAGPKISEQDVKTIESALRHSTKA
jgi:thiol:disulfide interchange protein